MPIETIDLTRNGATFARPVEPHEGSGQGCVIFSGIYKILLTEQQRKDLHRTLGESAVDNNGDK